MAAAPAPLVLMLSAAHPPDDIRVVRKEGAALAAAIGIPGLGLYLAARAVGLNTQVAPAAHEPRLQTVVNAGTGLGVLVSGPVALVVADDWRVAWAAFAAVALVVTEVEPRSGTDVAMEHSTTTELGACCGELGLPCECAKHLPDGLISVGSTPGALDGCDVL